MMTEQSNNDREVRPGDPTRPTMAPHSDKDLMTRLGLLWLLNRSANDSKATTATKALPTKGSSSGKLTPWNSLHNLQTAQQVDLLP